MPDDLDQPPRGYTTADVSAQRERPPRRWRIKRIKLILAAVVIVPVLLFGLYTWITLSYVYSRGERAGYVQKFSKKGWICKTWEGELAMVNLPGAAQEKFQFSVRDGVVAQQIERDMGRRVALTYEQHRGVPTSCFGETEYFVTNVRPAE